MIRALVLLLVIKTGVATVVTSKSCISDALELQVAVDDYLADPSPNSEVATSFGYPIGEWCVGRVKRFSGLFSAERNANATTFNEDLSGWNVSAGTSFREMFLRAELFDQHLGMWNTSSALNMAQMFHAAKSFNQPLDTWDVSGVNDMSEMFRDAEAFNQPLSSWDTSRVINMGGMFQGSSFNHPLDTWNVSSVRDATRMFALARSFNRSLCTWRLKLQPETEVDNMFVGTACPLQSKPIGSTGPFCYNCTATSCIGTKEQLWDAVNIYMADPSPLSRVALSYGHPIGSWCVSGLSDFSDLFSALRNANASTFNEDISQWDVSSATSMQSMFRQARAFNQNLSSWDVSSVANMDAMFQEADSFNGDIGGWNVAAVLSMRMAFADALSFQRNLCSWGPLIRGTTAVTTSMFLGSGCASQGDPVIAGGPVEPMCVERCSPPTSAPTSLPTRGLTSAPTSRPTLPPMTAPPVVVGNVTLVNATISTSTNVTQGAFVVVQGTLTVVPGSMLSVGDGGGAPVFQVTGDAIVTGGSANVALGEKPPPNSPVTVTVIEAASLSGSFDELTASVPDFDPECESLNVEQQTSGTSISAVVTLTNTCVGGLHPGALAGIIVGGIVLVALVVGLPIYLHERRIRKETEKKLQIMRDF